jgi:UPF0716 protein FxsA
VVIFLALLIFGAAEVAAFVVVAEHIGFLLALVLVVVISALGPFLVRRVGLGVLAHTRQRLERGEAPTRELLDGLVLLIGGALVCLPGFIGDVIGLLLMVGPVRHLVIRLAGRHLAHRVRTATGGRWDVIEARTRSRRSAPGALGPQSSGGTRPPRPEVHAPGPPDLPGGRGAGDPGP